MAWWPHPEELPRYADNHFWLGYGTRILRRKSCKKISRPILDDNAPGILTLIQAEALLQTAKECLPEMVVPIAIGLFAGLRRSELCALDWSEIDLSGRHIEIKGIKAKTRRRRLVSISDNLLEWLRPYIQESGPLTAGVDAFGEKLKHLVRGRPKTDDDPGRPAIVAEWPHNALRHSFGSYFFAKSKNENLTAAEMGNKTAAHPQASSPQNKPGNV